MTFDLHWLHEETSGVLAGEFGNRLEGTGWLRQKLGPSACDAIAAAARRLEMAMPRELHLPFLDRKTWRSLRPPATVLIECDNGGRMTVHFGQSRRDAAQGGLVLAGAIHARRNPATARFTLSFTDRRRLTAAQAMEGFQPLAAAYGLSGALSPSESVDASLTVQTSGGASAAWLEVPDESTHEFFEAFAKVSARLQWTLRRWAPYIHFSDLSRYDDPASAWPMLIYQASRPFSGRPKTEFTYDPINPAAVAAALPSARVGLPSILRRTHRLLLAAGKSDTAALYKPSRARAILKAVQKTPRALRALLAAETGLVDEMIKFAEAGRELNRQLKANPQFQPRSLSRDAEAFTRSLEIRLRRLGEEFLPLAPLLMVEATHALATTMGIPSELRALQLQ